LSYGQERAYLDSIKKVFDDTPDSSKSDIYLNLSINSQFTDLDLGLEFHKYVYDFAVSTDDNKLLVKSLIRLGESYFRQNDFENSLEYNFLVLSIVLETKDTANYFDCYDQIGRVYAAMDQNETALEYFLESEKYLEESGDPRDEISALANIASMYRNTGNNMLAQEKYKKALELSSKLDFRLPEGSLLLSIGNLFRDYLLNIDSARNYYDRALNFYSVRYNNQGYSRTLINYGNLYLLNRDYNKSEKLLLEGLELSIEIKDISLERDACKLLAELFGLIGNYTQAYEYQKKYSVLNDRILNDKIIGNIGRYEAQFESDRLYKESIIYKNSEIDKINLKRQRTFIILFFCIILILIVFATIYILQNIQRGKLLKVLSNKQVELRKINSELTISNKTKDKFFSLMAHDLKSPFNSILGFSQLIKTEAERDRNIKYIEYSKHIHSSADKALKLLENLLQWFGSRIGRIGYKPESTSLNEIFNKSIEFYKEAALKKNIKIRSTLTEDIKVYADINLLNTIMRNLLSNAIKFTFSQGNIILEAFNKNQMVQISVIDDGVGISKDVISDLFNIDKKISTVGTEGESGTGFGLALVKEFVEKNNGRIWVESEQGKGSKFFFTIPSRKK